MGSFTHIPGSFIRCMKGFVRPRADACPGTEPLPWQGQTFCTLGVVALLFMPAVLIAAFRVREQPVLDADTQSIQESSGTPAATNSHQSTTAPVGRRHSHPSTSSGPLT